MTNGHDFPADYIIGNCPYCKKPIKNIDRYFEGKLMKYIHIMCSKTPEDSPIKKDYRKRFLKVDKQDGGKK